MNGFGHVQKGFVNTEFFNIRRIFRKQGEHLPGISGIDIKTGGDNDQLRTFSQGGSNGFCRYHTVFFRRRGFGQDDTVTGTDIASDRGRNQPEILSLWIPGKAIYGLPA